MRKADLILYARPIEKARWLRTVKRGQSGMLDGWVMEGLQDAGLIDHKDNLTAAGEELLTQTKNIL